MVTMNLTLKKTAILTLMALLVAATPVLAWGGGVHQDACSQVWNLVVQNEEANLNADCKQEFVKACLFADEYAYHCAETADCFDDAIDKLINDAVKDKMISVEKLRDLFENKIGRDNLRPKGGANDEKVKKSIEERYNGDETKTVIGMLVRYSNFQMHGETIEKSTTYYNGPKLWEKILNENAYGDHCGREYALGVLMHNLEDSHAAPHMTNIENQLSTQLSCHSPYEMESDQYFPADSRYRAEPDYEPQERAIIGWYGKSTPHAGFLTICRTDEFGIKKECDWLHHAKDCDDTGKKLPTQRNNRSETMGSCFSKEICGWRVESVDKADVGTGPAYDFKFTGEGFLLPRGDQLGDYISSAEGVKLYQTPVDISYHYQDAPENARHSGTEWKGPVVLEASWVQYQTMFLNLNNYLMALTMGAQVAEQGSVCVLGTGATADPQYASGLKIADFAKEYEGITHSLNSACACTGNNQRGGPMVLDGASCAAPEKCSGTGIDSVGLVSAVYAKFGVPILSHQASQCLTGDRIPDKNGLLPGDIVCFGKEDDISASPAIYLGRVEGVESNDAIIHSNGDRIIVQSLANRDDFLWSVHYPLNAGGG